MENSDDAQSHVNAGLERNSSVNAVEDETKNNEAITVDIEYHEDVPEPEIYGR